MDTKIKILIGEHNSTDVELLHYQLAKDGFNYISEVVQNEQDYMYALKSFVPDIILSDYTFPSFSGNRAFEIREQISPDTPFIFVSGTIGEEESIALIKSGLTDYVFKDKLFTLPAKVNRALKEAQESKQKIKIDKALRKTKRLYFFLSNINQSIVHEANEELLFRNVCRIANEIGKFKMAWIGKFDKENKKIALIDHCGIPEEEIQLFKNVSYEDKGPQDHVLRTGFNYVCNDIVHELELESWMSFTTKHGIQSCMVLPIKKLGSIIGTLNLYSSELGFFDDEEIRLLVEAAGDISYALNMFELAKRHKTAEEVIVKSESRFRALIEKGTDIITVRSPEGKIFYTSPSVSSLIGYTDKELAHISVLDLVHPDDLSGLKEQTALILQTPGSSFFRQLRYRHKNGNWIWCEGTITNMIHEPGINGLVSNFKDVTDRKLLQEQQEFDNDNFTALINNTNDLMWSIDKDFKLITFNQPFVNTIKLVSGKELAKGDDVFLAVLSTEQLDKFKISYNRALAGEIFTEVEHIASAVESWSEISYYPIRKIKKIIGIACHSRDITQRKQTEEEIKQTEKKYRQIVETAQEGIWMLDENNITTFVNQKMCEILEYTEAEIIGRTNLSFKNADEQKIALQQIERRKKGLKETHESTFVTKTGRNICTQVSTNAIFDNDGNYKGALGMLTDITERKHADLLLQQSNQRYSDIFYLSPQPMWVFHPVTYKFIQVNKAAIDLYGYSEEEFLSMTILDIKQEEDISKAKEVLKSDSSKMFKQTIMHHKKSGELIEVEIYSKSIVINDISFRSVIAIDVTEKKMYEHKVIKAIIKTQEDERYEIGSELHDNVCQLLATSQLTLGMVKESIPANRIEFFDQGKEYITMALEEIRNLSHRLAPAFFDNSTLKEAFERLLDSFNIAKKYKILLHFDEAVNMKAISPDIQLNLHRILQEQLKNILKYAKASLIKVNMSVDNNKLKMEVSDNGVGLNMATVKGGIGLSNMKRRAELFSGKFEITSSPGQGCTVIVSISI